MFRIFLLPLLLISSCSAISDNMLGVGGFSNSDSFYERFPANKKSVILVKYAARSYKDPLFVCKVGSVGEEIKDIDGCYEVKGSDFYEMLVIEPGIYKLAKYSSKKDEYIFGGSDRVFSSKSSLGFKVSSTEVSYVGLLKKRGAQYSVFDEYNLVNRAFETRNYQELVRLFSNPLKEIEAVVTGYHELDKPMIKSLPDVMEGVKEVKRRRKRKSSESGRKITCSKRILRVLRKREKRIDADKYRYSKKYLRELKEDLEFDKKRCGV